MCVPGDVHRLRAIARTAAKSEPLHWTELDDGEKVLTDRHGGQLAEVRAEATLALQLAEQLSSIVEEVEVGLTPGRTFGPTLERRLRTSIATLARVYERDNTIASALEQAWDEEAEKRRAE